MTSKKTKAAERAERAAALLAEAKRKERRRNMIITSSVVLLVVIVLVAAVVIGNRKGKADVDKLPVAGQSQYGLTIGDADAPHTVIIYEDFLCPFCGELERVTHERLAAAAADGKVYLDYRPFVLLGSDEDRKVVADSYSARSLNALRVVEKTAGKDVAKKLHDLLYERGTQPSETETAPDDTWLIDRAVEAGADRDAVTDGIEDESELDWVKGATAEAFGGSVHSTPTVIVDGKELRNFRTVDDLAAALLEDVE